MASVATVEALRQQPACCSGRSLPCHRSPPLSLPAALRPRPACLIRRPAVRCAALAEDDTERQWGQTVKRFDFTYMSAADAAAAEAKAQAAWQAGMDEYAALQEWLLFRTWRFGLLFAGYLLLAASGEAAFCELVGAAAGYGYFKLLIADINKLQPGDKVPMREAEKVEPKVARWAAKLAAGYRQAFQPRLLVLPGLCAGVAAWNAAFPEDQLGLVEQGCLLGGYLSWKVALALKIYEDLKPRPLSDEEVLREKKPVLVEVEDVKLDLRELAKKKAQESGAAPPAEAGQGEQ